MSELRLGYVTVDVLDKEVVQIETVTRAGAAVIRYHHPDGTITDVDAQYGVRLSKGDA